MSNTSNSSISTCNFSSNSSEDEEHIELREKTKISRIFRDRQNPFDTLSEDNFKARFRFNKATVAFVLNLIEENIKPLTNRSQAISPLNNLIALRFYATGSFFMKVGDHFNVSEQTAGRIVHKVSHYLALRSYQRFYHGRRRGRCSCKQPRERCKTGIG